MTLAGLVFILGVKTVKINLNANVSGISEKMFLIQWVANAFTVDVIYMKLLKSITNMVVVDKIQH